MEFGGGDIKNFRERLLYQLEGFCLNPLRCFDLMLKCVETSVTLTPHLIVKLRFYGWILSVKVSFSGWMFSAVAACDVLSLIDLKKNGRSRFFFYFFV